MAIYDFSRKSDDDPKLVIMSNEVLRIRISKSSVKGVVTAYISVDELIEMIIAHGALDENLNPPEAIKVEDD